MVQNAYYCKMTREKNGFIAISSSSENMDELAKNANKFTFCIGVEGLQKAFNIAHQDFESKLQITGDLKKNVCEALKGNLRDIKTPLYFGHHLLTFLKTMVMDKFEQNRHVLVVYEKGKVNVPGGKRELSETCFEGTLRELSEETGIVMQSHWMLRETEQKYGGAASSEMKLVKVHVDGVNVTFDVSLPADFHYYKIFHEKAFVDLNVPTRGKKAARKDIDGGIGHHLLKNHSNRCTSKLEKLF